MEYAKDLYGLGLVIWDEAHAIVAYSQTPLVFAGGQTTDISPSCL